MSFPQKNLTECKRGTFFDIIITPKPQQDFNLCVGGMFKLLKTKKTWSTKLMVDAVQFFAYDKLVNEDVFKEHGLEYISKSSVSLSGWRRVFNKIP